MLRWVESPEEDTIFSGSKGLMYGTHPAIDEIIGERLLHTSQQPTSQPAGNYWVYVTFNIIPNSVRIIEVNVSFNGRHGRQSCFYDRDGGKEGTLNHGNAGGLSRVYLEDSAGSLHSLEDTVQHLLDQQRNKRALKRLTKVNPLDIPAEDPPSEDDAFRIIAVAHREANGDIVAENLENTSLD